MCWSRHSAVVRTFVFLFLLWAGVDLVLHGLIASDFAPLATNDSSTSPCVEDGGAGAHSAPDYCFCHAPSLGAVVPAPTSVPAPVSTFVFELSLEAPLGDPHPLDRPPQPTL